MNMLLSSSISLLYLMSKAVDTMAWSLRIVMQNTACASFDAAAVEVIDMGSSDNSIESLFEV
jgi:hypothetical protein